MVRQRGGNKKKPISAVRAAAQSALTGNSNNNNNTSNNTDQLDAVLNNKQKTWLERLNSDDPHQREDGCDDITSMVSSSTLNNNENQNQVINHLLQSLFQSGVLMTLVKILLTDAEPSVRISATSALQNIASVGGDAAVDAIVGLSVPSSSSSENNNNTTISFVSALLDAMGNTFETLAETISHFGRYEEFQEKKKRNNQNNNNNTIPDDEVVPYPKTHPEIPNRMITELMGLSCILTSSPSVANQFGRSEQLLTALVRTAIDSGYGGSSSDNDNNILKYYSIRTREALACSCAELVYVLSSNLSSSVVETSSSSGNNNNPVTNFFTNSIPENYRVKIDSLISLSNNEVEQLITRSPSRLCIALYLAGAFIACFPGQSLRVVPLLTLCMKGESVINVTQQTIPLLSADAVNEKHQRIQRQLREKEENGGNNSNNNNDDEDEDEEGDGLEDDRDAQLLHGPFRSLKVFHTAFSIAHEVLNYVAAGDLGEVFVDDHDNNHNDNNDEVEILEETDDDDETFKFISSGAYDAFQNAGLINASLMRCGETVSLPTDVVLRSALFDPSANGHVMNLQSNFHSTVTAILSFNAALLMLLPFSESDTMINNNGSNKQQEEAVRSFLSRVPVMWSSAFDGLSDRTNAINYTSNSKNNSSNNNNFLGGSLWSGVVPNHFLQIEALVSMVWSIERRSLVSASKSSSSSSSTTIITPQPQQVDLLRTLFFDPRYQNITSDTRVAVTGCMGQIALSASKHNQTDALQSCTKFLVEMLTTAVARCTSSNSDNNNNNSTDDQNSAVALDVAAEAADVLMDAFSDERFDANVYKPQNVHSALRQFHPLLKPYGSTKGLKRKSPRYQQLNAVYRNLGAFMEYKVQNGAA